MVFTDRLAQGRCWTISGIGDDRGDACGVESGARWAKNSLRIDELYDAQMQVRRKKVVFANLNAAIPRFRRPLIAMTIDG